jgi:hypothetical protein
MLAHSKKILEYDSGQIAIDKRFDKPITSLRTAVEKGDGSLDKEATSHDTSRLACCNYELPKS